jgi:hypothetical protein
LAGDQKRLEETLAQAIKSNFMANFRYLVLDTEGQFKIDNWTITRDSRLSVSALSVDENPVDPRVSFRYSFVVTNSADQKAAPLEVGAEASFIVPLRATAETELEISLARIPALAANHLWQKDIGPPSLFYELFFPSKENSDNVYKIGAWLGLPLDTWTKLKAWIDGEHGHPSRSSGEWFRMFYLSATTMTTIGFGDIVPITPLARGWVTSQAIAGVVLIGLFINDVANPIGGRARPAFLLWFDRIVATPAIERWFDRIAIGFMVIAAAIVFLACKHWWLK